jgi:hypothetical protein
MLYTITAPIYVTLHRAYTQTSTRKSNTQQDNKDTSNTHKKVLIRIQQTAVVYQNRGSTVNYSLESHLQMFAAAQGCKREHSKQDQCGQGKWETKHEKGAQSTVL